MGPMITATAIPEKPISRVQRKATGMRTAYWERKTLSEVDHRVAGPPQEADEGYYMVEVSNYCGVAYDTAFQEVWECAGLCGSASGRNSMYGK